MRENSEMAFMFLAAISIKIWKDAIFSKGQRSIISILVILDSSRPVLSLPSGILTGEQIAFNLQLQNGVFTAFLTLELGA